MPAQLTPPAEPVFSPGAEPVFSPGACSSQQPIAALGRQIPYCGRAAGGLRWPRNLGDTRVRCFGP